MALLLIRLLQVTWQIATGRGDLLIVSHEVDEQIENSAEAKD
jgi:hypothetical protein